MSTTRTENSSRRLGLARGVVGPGPRRSLLFLFVMLLIGGVLAAAPASAAPITLDLKARTIFGTPTTGAHDLLDIYDTANGWGMAYLDPENPIHPLDHNQNLYFNFFNILSIKFPESKGWKIVGDARNFSDGSIKVHTYDADGRPTRVGNAIDIEYVPKANTVDPTANMHWIQIVSDNHNITDNPGHGNLENIVDLAADNPTNPYYDVGTPVVANSRNFLDTPRRGDVEANHDWIAALFLVSGPLNPGTVANPATITVFNNAGITWGWKNRFFRNAALGAFHDEVHREFLDELPQEQFVLYHNEFHAELGAVPEPSSFVLIVLAGSTCYLRYGVRRRWGISRT